MANVPPVSNDPSHKQSQKKSQILASEQQVSDTLPPKFEPKTETTFQSPKSFDHDPLTLLHDPSATSRYLPTSSSPVKVTPVVNTKLAAKKTPEATVTVAVDKRRRRAVHEKKEQMAKINEIKVEGNKIEAVPTSMKDRTEESHAKEAKFRNRGTRSIRT